MKKAVAAILIVVTFLGGSTVPTYAAEIEPRESYVFSNYLYMFSYFTSIVRVSEVKRKRLFSGCTHEADKAELTEREPHALITHLFIPIASRHRHYDSLQRHLISKTKSPTRKEGDFIRSVHHWAEIEQSREV